MNYFCAGEAMYLVKNVEVLLDLLTHSEICELFLSINLETNCRVALIKIVKRIRPLMIGRVQEKPKFLLSNGPENKYFLAQCEWRQ